MKNKKIGNKIRTWITRHIWYISKDGTAIYIDWDIFRIIRTNITWFSVNFPDKTGFMQKCARGGKVLDVDGNNLNEIYAFYSWNLYGNQWSFMKLTEPREMKEDNSDVIRYTEIHEDWKLVIGKKEIKV